MTSEVKPYFKSVKLQGMFISIELTKHPKASIDDYLKAVKERMGDLIVFVKCPKCGREVPKIDMTVHGYCYICFHQQQASEQNRKPLI
jgi:uncharacterized OB-fold protein